jgi:hypothetical protein
MKINRDWHLANKMPKNPTEEVRARWHTAHSENCTCREMTPAIKKLVEAYK